MCHLISLFNFGDYMLLNRKCNYCGNEYYICRACIRTHNVWKNVCCSRECFTALQDLNGIKPIMINQEEIMKKKVILRGELKNRKTIGIVGYDLDLGRFDGEDGKTYSYDDFYFLYMRMNELKDIVDTIKKQTETRVRNEIEKTSKKPSKVVTETMEVNPVKVDVIK